MRGLYETLFGSRYPLPSQMSDLERMTMITILEHLKPAAAIEIGSAQGGSLQILSAHAGKAYSLDVDSTVPQRLAQFPNVEFRIGPSHVTLPILLAELRNAQTPCPFVLIDGDHEAAGVRRDIEALISVPPLTTTFVLLHDSFNPECREGMRTAAWDRSPHVHDVQLDFVPGWFHSADSDTPRRMWAGFALAILSPEVRRGPLQVRASQGETFQQMHRISAHWREGR